MEPKRASDLRFPGNHLPANLLVTDRYEAGAMLVFMAARKTVEVLASAARTATPSSVEVMVPGQAHRVAILTDVTSITDTPSITVSVKGVDPSGTEYEILAGSALSSVTHEELYVGDLGGAGVANQAEPVVLPDKLIIDVTHADADSITYSVFAILE